MPVETPVRAAGPAQESARLLTDLLHEALSRHGTPPPLDVAPLGVRDAFAPVAAPAGPTAPDTATAAVPVRFYGRHAVVGPFATARGSGPQPCAHCLERRWQAVRSVALREALELGSGTRAAGESPTSHRSPPTPSRASSPPEPPGTDRTPAPSPPCTWWTWKP